QIAQILSGYSLGEADLLRRAMGKKKKEEMDKQRKRFIEGAAANGVDGGRASSIFDLVQKFAGYGFNKSHAAAYAYIAYQTAWLKANYPAEFLAASMSLDRANTDKLAVFLKEARRIGVEVLAPHINHSQADFSVREGAIAYALSAVKNVGEGAMALIAEARDRGGPFTDLIDFAERVDLKVVGKRAIENLARAGALDGLGASRAGAFAAADLLIRISAEAVEARDSAQGGLFALDAAPSLQKPVLPRVDEWVPQTRLDEERAAVGFYFSGHPLDDYERELARLRVTTYHDALARAKSGRSAVQMAAVVRVVRMRRSKAGKPFAWVELSDATGEFEITVFSETLNAARDLLEPGALVLVGATVEERDGDVRFTAEAIRPLDAAAAAAASQLRVAVSSEAGLEGVRRRLAAVKPASAAEAGQVIVSMRLAGSGRDVD
ncbi:MAG: helix-hairpin-helix domain-containing protein, partial [Hyphococcus sp.]